MDGLYVYLKKFHKSDFKEKIKLSRRIKGENGEKVKRCIICRCRYTHLEVHRTNLNRYNYMCIDTQILYNTAMEFYYCGTI